MIKIKNIKKQNEYLKSLDRLRIIDFRNRPICLLIYVKGARIRTSHLCNKLVLQINSLKLIELIELFNFNAISSILFRYCLSVHLSLQFLIINLTSGLLFLKRFFIIICHFGFFLENGLFFSLMSCSSFFVQSKKIKNK